jgi:DHA1 family tetracycline resistance protein-like MFS transporter
VLLIILIPLSLAAGILNTVLNSLLSKSVYHEDVGGTLGLSSGLESVTRIFAPIIGGILLGQIGTWAPGIFGTLLMTAATLLVWQRLIAHPDPPLPARAQEESAPVGS